MGGQAGMRGYLVQALIAVLDSLKDEDNWISVSLEPNGESEKVDICWKYNDSRIKVIQVKSTINSFGYSEAKKWASELKEKTPNATEYYLYLVGRLDNKLYEAKDKLMGKTAIKNTELNIDNLNAQIINRIDEFFTIRGKAQLSINVKRIITKSLNYDFTENSIYGKELSRTDFDNQLLTYLNHIQEYLSRNLYTPLIAPVKADKDLGDKYNLTKNILKLIGWSNLNENERLTVYNNKTDKDEAFHLDFYADYDSRLKDNEFDNIFIKSYFDTEYPINPQSIISESSHSIGLISNKLIENGKLKNNNCTNHAIQFLLSIKESECNINYIEEVRSCYKSNILAEGLNYYSVDNRQLNFLISSIITARMYRDAEKLVVKFLYPITENNSTEGKIGKRNIFLPPQYINTSVLPIVKESHDKISVLLFCADKYSKDRLRKLIWLLIRLTSGFANEYKIYFPDYSIEFINEVNEVIRSYHDDELAKKLTVCSITAIESSKLKDTPLIDTDGDLIDEEFNTLVNDKKIVKINPHLVEFLPYGDLIKPFLDSEFINAQDLKIFLSQKGIFFKGANKKNIIHLMTSLLFSPAEIENLIELVSVKDKPMKGSDKSYPMLMESSVSQIMNNNVFNFSDIDEGLGATILSDMEFKPTKEDPNVYVWEGLFDQENPTKQAMVSHSIGRGRITLKREANNFVIDKEYNSAPARIAVERITKKIAGQLVEKNIIEEKVREVLFAEFENKERANFLLSFTNIEDTNIFKESDTTSVKYAFDESKNIPDEYNDKVGKELVQSSYGKNLSGLKEITQESFKEIIFLEEISISYKFNWLGIRGYYNVKLNFSGALKNKPVPDGSFQFQPKISIWRSSKAQVSNMKSLEQELKKEFFKMRMNRYKQFNKM